MHRVLLALVVAAPAVPALAQSVLEPSPLPGAPTCGGFTALDPAGRLEMLTTIQPLGDEIHAEDAGAARQWSDEVAAACAGQPDRPLADAATEALGAD
jgi:hypothetical protein